MGKLAILMVLVAVLALYIGYNLIDRFNGDDIRGKRVLVTGASTGIGEQVAYQYAKLGAKVMVTARREAVLKKVVAECARLSGHNENYYIMADMADLKNINKITEAVKRYLGGLDILVINHVAPYRPGIWLGKENLTEFEFQTKLNYHSYIHLASHALPLLEESPGSSIIVVNSVAGVAGFLINSPYAGAKFGINGFFKSLRSQFNFFGQNISVTECFLGAIRTAAGMAILSDNKVFQHPKTEKKLFLNIPDKSYCEVNDTAYQIVRSGALKEEDLFYPRIFRYFMYPGLNTIYHTMLKMMYQD